MAATTTITRRFVPGDRTTVTATFTPDTSYTTGGYAVSASTFKLASIDLVTIHGQSNGKSAVYDKGTGKILIYTTQGMAEVAGSSDQSAQSWTVTATGIQA